MCFSIDGESTDSGRHSVVRRWSPRTGILPFHHRTTVCLISSVLVLLATYNFLRPGVLEPSRCQQPTIDCTDRIVQLTHHTHVIQLLPDGFVIEQLGVITQVVGDKNGLTPGNPISLRGTWQADGTIRAEAWHVLKYRRWRRKASIPAVLLGAWIFWRAFRWDGSRRVFVERHCA